MNNPYVKLQPDLFASDQNNYVAQTVTLQPITDFPYYIFSPFQGGFYTKDIKLYDADDNLLEFNSDYVVSYFFKNLSRRVGLDIYQAVIIINPNIQGKVTLLARYVGGDLAYSTTVVTDYVNFWKADPHVPYTEDYVGYEPKWQPGELDQIRWGTDRHYNLDVALFKLSESLRWTDGDIEDTYRQQFDQLMVKTNELQTLIYQHISDSQNPHQLNNQSVDLGNIKNYTLATYSELLNNVAGKYVTPKVSSEVIVVKFKQPYLQHVQIKGNPHNNIAEDYDSYSVSYVDSVLNNKWTITDTVNNTQRINAYSLVDLVNYLNTQLTPTNFVELIPSERLGDYLTDNPDPKEHVLGNQSKWVNWKSLSNSYRNHLGYPIYTLAGTYATKEQAILAANLEYGGITRGLVKYTLEKTIVKDAQDIVINISGLLIYQNNSWS